MNGKTNTTVVTNIIEGVQVPLEAPTNLSLTPLNARVDITWTDPVDKYAAPDGQTAANPWDNVAAWDHSIIVRKAGSAPTGPEDGELIYTETVRNQHQYSAYSDTNNVINNTLYYYAVFAITQLGTISEPISASCTPIEGTPVFYDELGPLKQSYRFNPNPGSIDSYALFAGGQCGNPNFTVTSSVDTFDESLTQGTTDYSYSVGPGISSTTGPNHVLFAGGYKLNYYNDAEYLNTVVTFDKSLTRSYAPTLSFFAADIGAATLLNTSIFAGGNTGRSQTNQVDTYDESLTKSSLDNLPRALSRISGGTVGTHAVFGGGLYNSTAYGTVISYDQSMTRSTLSNLGVSRCACGCASLDNYIMFAGGTYYGESYNEGYNNAVDAYDSSLTKLSNVPALSIPSASVFTDNPTSAIRNGSYILILSGTSMSEHGFTKYDSSLTQTTVDGGDTVINNCHSTRFASVGNYALIPGYGANAPVYAFKAI